MGQFQNWMRNTGVAVDPTLTPKEKLQMAGLDYEVITVPAGYYVNGEWITSGDKYTIRADRNDIHYGPVFNRKPWGNQQFLEVLENTLRPEGYTITHIGNIDHGAITYYGVELPITQIGNEDREQTYHYLLVMHGHRRDTGVMVSKFSNRTYCTNGANVIIRKRGAITHSSTLNDTVVRILNGAIQEVLELVNEGVKYDHILAGTKVPEYKVQSHLLELYGKRDNHKNLLTEQPKSVQRVLDKVLSIYYNGKHRTSYTDSTAYGLMQAVMEYEAHGRVTKDPENADNRVMKSLLGVTSGRDTRYARINSFRNHLEQCYILGSQEPSQKELVFV